MVQQGNGEIEQLRSGDRSRKTNDAEDRIGEFRGLESGIKVNIANARAEDLAREMERVDLDDEADRMGWCSLIKPKIASVGG
jgi:hypothetical protein